MTRQELINYIFDEYSVEPDFPFRMDDVTCVFRHIDNRKWFGIAMVIPYNGNSFFFAVEVLSNF